MRLYLKAPLYANSDNANRFKLAKLKVGDFPFRKSLTFFLSS